MRYRSLSIGARGVGSMAVIAAGVLGCAGASEATYIGLTVVSAGDHMVNGAMRTSWRVFAVCSDPDDYIGSVAGSPTLGNFVVQMVSSSGSAPGGEFVNVAGGGAKAPTQAAVDANPELEWDTFVDIGLTIVPEGA
jgi:hypothetical protein